MTATSTNPKPATPPRRLRFTLRLLLAGITVLCVGLGIWTHRAREQRRIVESIRKGSGEVYYDYGTETTTLFQVPLWLVNLLGDDYFRAVTHVTTSDPKTLPALHRIQGLKSLDITAHWISDEDLLPIAQLESLKWLGIHPIISRGAADVHYAPMIGDKSLELIAALPALESASVCGVFFTPQGLQSLATSSSLRETHVRCYDPNVDELAVERFPIIGRDSKLFILRRASEGSQTKVMQVEEIVE